MNNLRTFALSMLAMLLAGITLAQVNNKGININSQQGTKAGTTYALIVGISKYQNVQSLTFADADAYNFYQYLISPGGGNIDSNNIKLFLNENATAANIFQEGLDWLLDVAKEGDNVIIYFSGHGDLETKTIMQNGFLLAYNAPKSCYQAGGTIGLGYLQNYLSTLIDRNKAKVIMISDACKSGKLTGGVDGATNTTMALQQQWSNVIKILSSQAGELSQEGKKWGNGAGVFSFYLLNGMKGMADMNRDKKVTLMELFIYLSENVARETGNTQNPAIVGNQSTVMAYVDSATLASIEKIMQSSGQGETQLAMKGFGDNVLNLLDPNVRTLYDKFQLCIKRDYLLEGPDSVGYAWDYYVQLAAIEGAESILNSVKRTLLAALQNKSQIAINNWVKGEDIPDTISTYTAYYELYYALELVDSTYIMYDYIKARYLFWKSVYTDDPAEKITIMKECVRIEPNAPFAYQQLGSVSLKQKDYRAAISYYKRAIELAPGWTYPVNDLGVTYDDMSMTDSAIWCYRHAVELDPYYPLSYNNLANTYTDLEQYDTAMTFVDRAIGLNPEKGLYYITKGIIFRNKEMYDQAIMLIQEGIAKEPNDADNYYQLGITYQDMDEYPKAITSFKEAIARDNEVPKYHKELGRTYIYMGKYERAQIALDAAIDLAPKADEPHALYALSWLYQGKYIESIKSYKKAIALDSMDAYNWRMLSRAYRTLGEYDLSISAAKHSVKLDDTDQWNWYYLSLAYNVAGKYTEAVENAQKTLAFDPTYADFEINLADAYCKSGDLKSGMEHYNKALVLSPNDPAIYSNMGYAYTEAGDLSQAETCYIKALDLEPKNTARYIALGEFFRSDKKDYGKAEYYYKKAIELDADNYRIYEGMGYLYIRMENTKKAAEAFNKAIELAPDVAWNYYNLACLYSLSGNTKKALVSLEQAFQKGMQDLGHIKIDTDLDPIRQDAGFKALMKKYFSVDL